MIYILVVLLILGLAFVCIPESYLAEKPRTSLRTRPLKIDSLRCIVLLVSNGTLENTVTYQTVEEFAGSNPNRYDTRYVWLIYGGTSNQEGSSFRNANDLVAKFSGDSLKLSPQPVNNINDSADAYSVVDGIFRFEIAKYELQESEVVCDFTGGTKPMSIGMALACMGRRRLIYHSQDLAAKDKKLFLEVDTISLFHSAISAK